MTASESRGLEKLFSYTSDIYVNTDLETHVEPRSAPAKCDIVVRSISSPNGTSAAHSQSGKTLKGSKSGIGAWSVDTLRTEGVAETSACREGTMKSEGDVQRVTGCSSAVNEDTSSSSALKGFVFLPPKVALQCQKVSKMTLAN